MITTKAKKYKFHQKCLTTTTLITKNRSSTTKYSYLFTKQSKKPPNNNSSKNYRVILISKSRIKGRIKSNK